MSSLKRCVYEKYKDECELIKKQKHIFMLLKFLKNVGNKKTHIF